MSLYYALSQQRIKNKKWPKYLNYAQFVTLV